MISTSAKTRETEEILASGDLAYHVLSRRIVGTPGRKRCEQIGLCELSLSGHDGSLVNISTR